MSDCGFTRKKWLETLEEVSTWACALYKTGELTYGNSGTQYPCSDQPVRFISCDRHPARAMYSLGLRDQRKGGETTETMYQWFPAHGAKTITSVNDLQPGDVVEMTDGVHSAPVGNGLFHIFTVKSVNGNGTLTKWDFGSNQRMADGGVFTVPINGGLFEWAGAKRFFRAWRLPYKEEAAPKKKTVTKVETIECGIGTADTAGATFKLPEYGTYLVYTGHSSSAALNGEWIARAVKDAGKVSKIGGGGSVTISIKGKDLTVKTKSGNVNVFLIRMA